MPKLSPDGCENSEIWYDYDIISASLCIDRKKINRITKLWIYFFVHILFSHWYFYFFFAMWINSIGTKLNTGFYQHDAIRQFHINEVNENLCVKVNFPISITTLCLPCRNSIKRNPSAILRNHDMTADNN